MDTKVVDEVLNLKRKKIAQKIIAEQLKISQSSVSKIVKENRNKLEEVDTIVLNENEVVNLNTIESESTQSNNSKIIEYFKEGLSHDKISKLLVISKRRIKNTIKAYKLRNDS